MIPGFHVGGMLLHDQAEAISQVARLGYRCVSIKPRPGSLAPHESQFGDQVSRIAEAVARAGVRLVLDADALFMHEPTVPRGPSLVTLSDSNADLARQWIEQWIDVADRLHAELITFSSGQADSSAEAVTAEQSLERLAVQLNHLASRAAGKKVRLALRPRSGDAIATVAHFERLRQWLDEPDRILLAADIGEMLVGHEFPVSDRLARNVAALACVYLCDHRTTVVGDQRIGHGDVALSRITRSLAEQGFAGPAIVRVDGHSELGFVPAAEAIHIFAGLGI